MNQSSVNSKVSSGEVASVGGDALTSFDSRAQTMESIQQNDYNSIPQHQQHSQSTNNSKNVFKNAYVKITEQPAGKALRFRYECEGRSAGSIPGLNSTSENKTFPTIEIVGYKGRAVVVVSCVTKDQPYRPHPHNLVGKEGCKKGVCTLEINPDTMRAVFSNLGIQCVKKKDIEAALKAREEIRVDPFKTGFTHRFQPTSIDLNSVRLCFQVFMESDQKGRFTQPLQPVVSEPIYDKKAMYDLAICRLCSSSASVLGNTDIILLCEKVAKDDISVRFYEERNGQTIWEAYGEFDHRDVHKQTAIAFKTPRYHKIDITEPAKVFIQLKRPSDGATSEPFPFEYVPLDSDPAPLKRKRQNTNGDFAHLLLQQQENQHDKGLNDHPSKGNYWMNVPVIKTEPRDTSPHNFRMHRATQELTPSPQAVSPTEYAQNTPSPYNMNSTPPAGTQSRHQLMSPNQQCNVTRAVGSSITPRMVINEYNIYSQQAQQYNDSNFGSVGHWESKFNPAAPVDNNLSNLLNPYTIHNSLPARNGTGTPGTGQNNTGWNITSNHFHPEHQHQQYPPHPTQSEPPATNNNGNITNAAGANNNIASVSNANQTEHGLSNLLKMDSEQYIRINTEDQQMLGLNSEDLQISNLSISA